MPSLLSAIHGEPPVGQVVPAAAARIKDSWLVIINNHFFNHVRGNILSSIHLKKKIPFFSLICSVTSDLITRG